MPKRTSDPKYLRARAAILAGNPMCHWCQRREATEAYHLIEHDQGGTDSTDNLVPSCKPCNSRRGNQYRQRKERDAKGVFYENKLPPNSPMRPSFSDNPEQPELARIDHDHLEVAPTGRDEPRLESAHLGGIHFGDAVAAWASKYLQVNLFPWQVRALAGQLQCDESGNLVFREALISTARQNGKSVALQALIGWAVTEYAEHLGRAVHVLSTANQLDRAEAIHTSLAPALVEYWGGKNSQVVGRKSVTRLPHGSTWNIRAATARLHGGSYDLIVVDELWNIPAMVIDEALRPSMIARPAPLLSCWSTAGDATSEAMIRMRERGVSEIDQGDTPTLYFAEWSLPPGVSADDERYWGYANPSLGHTITVQALRAAKLNESFARAHLNQWITARGAWLDPGEWGRQKVDHPFPAGGVLAIDSSIDSARYVGVRAAQLDGRVMVSVEFVCDTEQELWAHVARVMADRNITLAVTPSLIIHVPVDLQRRATTVGYRELTRYTGLVRSMIKEGRVVHDGNEQLAEHIERAVLVKSQNTVVLSSQKSPGPIEIARCTVWAVSLVSRPVSNQRPVMAIVQ